MLFNRSVVIVESPFQLITAIEYHQDKKFTLIFLNLGNERNCSIVEHLAERFKLNLVIIRRVSPYYRFNSIYIGIILTLKILFYNKLILGDIREIHFKILIASSLFLQKKLVVLDDGTSSLFLLKKLENLAKKGSEVFTFFGDSLLFNKHKFDYLKGLMDTDLVERSIIIGSSIVETNSITDESYWSYLDMISCMNLDIYYVPHRNEDKLRVDKISRTYGWKIWNLEYPLELIYLSGFKPSHIFSVTSSAMLTLLSIYTNVKTYYYLFGDNWLDSIHGTKMKFIESEIRSRLVYHPRVEMTEL